MQVGSSQLIDWIVKALDLDLFGLDCESVVRTFVKFHIGCGLGELGYVNHYRELQ